MNTNQDFFSWLLAQLQQHARAVYQSTAEQDMECAVNERLQYGVIDGCMVFPGCASMNFNCSDSRAGSVVIDLGTERGKISVTVARYDDGETAAVATANTWVPTAEELTGAERDVLYAMTHPVPRLSWERASE